MSNISKAPYPLKVSGKTFQASPLTDKDYDELDNYIRSEIIDVARASLNNLSPTERMEMLQAAIKAAASSGWGSVEGNRIINTVVGTIRLGWQMIKVNHIQLEFEEFLQITRVTNQALLKANLEEIDTVFTIQNVNKGEISFSEEQGGSSTQTKS